MIFWSVPWRSMKDLSVRHIGAAKPLVRNKKVTNNLPRIAGLLVMISARWRGEDSNFQPRAYESLALPTIAYRAASTHCRSPQPPSVPPFFCLSEAIDQLHHGLR